MSENKELIVKSINWTSGCGEPWSVYFSERSSGLKRLWDPDRLKTRGVKVRIWDRKWVKEPRAASVVGASRSLSRSLSGTNERRLFDHEKQEWFIVFEFQAVIFFFFWFWVESTGRVTGESHRICFSWKKISFPVISRLSVAFSERFWWRCFRRMWKDLDWSILFEVWEQRKQTFWCRWFTSSIQSVHLSGTHSFLLICFLSDGFPSSQLACFPP